MMTSEATVSPAQTSREPAWPLRLAIFLVLLGSVLLAPIWLVKYPPLLDYPNHLASAFVLAHLHDPSFRFDQDYGADWGPYPYLTLDLSLLALQRFLPVELAGRVYLSLCVLAVPLAAWFFLRQANPGQDPQALWALLIAYNLFFLYGFLNFTLSLALCFLAVGLWLRCLTRPSLFHWCLTGVAVMAVYFTHLVGFIIAGLVITAYGALARRKLREMIFPWLLFLPGALFYLASSRVGLHPRGIIVHGFREKLDSLSAMLHSYSPRLDQATVLALVIYFLAARWRNPSFQWNSRWLGVAALLFGAYWVIPWGYGEQSDLDIRVLPVVFVLILATARVGRRGWRLAPLVLLLFLVRTANVAQNFFAAQPQLSGLAQSFSVTVEHARVLPIVEATDEDEPIRHPFAHFWAYGVIRRGWFSPYLFQAKGLMPLEVRSEAYTPDGFWDLTYKESPDWTEVQQDYDYVWAYNVPRFSPALETIGELVYESGDLQVFRVNKSAGEEAGASSPAGDSRPR